MQLRTEITPSELTEAMRLNRTRMYWPKVFLANWYATLLLIVVVWAEIARMIDGKPVLALLSWPAIDSSFLSLVLLVSHARSRQKSCIAVERHTRLRNYRRERNLCKLFHWFHQLCTVE